jgi:uncharacterized protein (DUF4415 family)
MKAKRRKSPGKKRLGGKKTSSAASRSPAGVQDWVTGAGRLFRPIKKPVTLRLDADVLLWFKGRGRGYQTRINQALRGVMIKERKAGG